MLSWNYRFFGKLVLILLLCSIQVLYAQKKKFEIEDWEVSSNRRQPPVKIMDAVGFKEGMIIGEVGAGTGRMTMWIADRVGDVDNPKLPRGKLDIAFMINVYHHLDEPIPLIANIIPSLKKGGLLVIVECDPDKVEWGKSHGCMKKEDMTRHLEKAGFNVIRIENILNEDSIYISEVKDKDG